MPENFRLQEPVITYDVQEKDMKTFWKCIIEMLDSMEIMKHRVKWE